MHPFYSYSEKFLGGIGSEWIGLVSMAMYLIFWGVVIVFAHRFAKKYFMNSKGLKQDDSAVQILRERYAKGEISSEEYRRVRDDLDESGDGKES